MYGLQCLLHFSASSSFIFSELWEFPQSWVQSKVCLVTMEAKYQKKQWENALLQSSPHERLKGHWGPSTVETPQPQQMKRGTQKKHIYTSIVLHEYCFWRRSRSSTHGQRPCRWLQHVSSWGLLKGDPQQYKLPMSHRSCEVHQDQRSYEVVCHNDRKEQMIDELDVTGVSNSPECIEVVLLERFSRSDRCSRVQLGNMLGHCYGENDKSTDSRGYCSVKRLFFVFIVDFRLGKTLLLAYIQSIL